MVAEIVRGSFAPNVVINTNFNPSEIERSPLCPVRLVARTPPFHGENAGSIPAQGTSSSSVGGSGKSAHNGEHVSKNPR